MVIELKQRLGRFGRFQHRLSVVFRRTWKYGTHFDEFRAEDLFACFFQDFRELSRRRDLGTVFTREAVFAPIQHRPDARKIPDSISSYWCDWQ